MRKKKIMTVALAATLSLSLVGGTAYARSSKRAAWNDASSDKSVSTIVRDACYVEDGSETDEHNVFSNVYANSVEWTAYKTEWEKIKNNYEQVALTPGKDATQINLAWYSLQKETPRVKLMDDKGKTIKIFKGTLDEEKAEVFDTTTLYPNKVTVTGLEENTTYKYSYLIGGKWSETYEYTTKSTDKFSVMYVGDPQIGASTGQTTADGTSSADNGKEYYAMNDAYNWYHTLNQATSANKDLSFLISAGDQINQTSVSNDADKLQQQMEYAGFLAPSVLRSLPIATTIGNHDSQSQNYGNHFNNPNSNTDATADSKTVAGTDYYFRYGNALFISINTNNYNCAIHESVINEAVENNKDATWRILFFHQDIYGSGYDHSDSDGMILRTQLTPIIDEYDIDAVLQGHDHTYSRTHQISANGYKTAFDNTSQTNTEEYYSENASCYTLGSDKGTTVTDPEGTVYFEANSSTGSKYYQMIGTQQDYIAARSQSWRPTYSVINFTKDSMTVKTYDAATNEELIADGGISTTYTIKKTINENNGTESTTQNPTIEKTEQTTENEAPKVTVKKVSLKSVKNTSKKTITVKYKKIANATGYKINYATNKSFKKGKTVTVKKSTTVSKKIKNLKKNKTYYVRVKAYNVTDGKTTEGKWSKILKVKIKK